ncbi:MAG: zinc metallopeptidase [Flavobacteriales bacterium]|nr:zinc metallopeptidase [Flavobacteriales bacterium]
MGAYLIGGIIAFVGMIVQGRLRSKFKQYSETPISSNLSGKEIAEKMLRDNGIYDVKVISVQGQLTDHYNPVNKTVNLSEAVYNYRNAAAAAVAAHECGHAVQHANAYSWLEFRSKMVPAVKISSTLVQFVLIGGILMVNTFPNLLLAGIVLFAVTTLFSFVTLPVEFDASRRALVWMRTSNVVSTRELEDSKDALKWAALTYVVAALGSLATLLYYVSVYLNRR